jgi:hypothetical protein
MFSGDCGDNVPSHTEIGRVAHKVVPHFEAVVAGGARGSIKVSTMSEMENAGIIISTYPHNQSPLT